MRVMRVTDLALALAALAVAVPAAGAPAPDGVPAGEVARAAAPAVPAATAAANATPPAGHAAAPASTTASPAATTAATPTPATTATTPASPAPAPAVAGAAPRDAASTSAAALVGPQGSAVAAKVAQGDRERAAGDLRAALFAYLDAVYLEPTSAAARVKLGRTYLALGYPAQARAQAEQALALDGGSTDARQLLDDAVAGRVPPRAAALGGGVTPVASSAAAGGPDAGTAGPRVYRITPEPAPPPQRSPAASAAPAATPGGGAGDRYRAGVALIARREYAGAVLELDAAIAQDGRLAVAYAARASARFGLGRHRAAAEDYAAALAIDPGLATPLYGLAECYRLTDDPRAADFYGRYAASRAADVREDLRTLAARRAKELAGR